MTLAALIESLRSAPGLLSKRDIAEVARALPQTTRARWLTDAVILNGDDAAAIPDGDGFVLLAGEGMLPSFVARDPWFAGFCAVLVNVSDILAMGGRPYAVVDMLFAGNQTHERLVLEGLRDAALRLGVPVVGGHTSRIAGEGTLLAASIVGRAKKLISSFEAKPGDQLIYAVDLRGRYRSDAPYYDAATTAPAEQLQMAQAVLPQLAEEELVRAGKDVSMAGLCGTLIMMCEASGVGATLALDALPRPTDTDLLRWLCTFPSYGFLLSVHPGCVAQVHARFAAVGITSSSIGRVDGSRLVQLTQGKERAQLWDLTHESLTGFAKPAAKS